MLASSKVFLAGSVLALAALPALSTEETKEASNVAVSAAQTAVVRCPGVSSVPLTTDAEQALPLRLAGHLACGEIVSVLAENDGYTAQVRRKDGQEGYVAVIYLGHERTVAPAHKVQASAQPVNGVVRWAAGADGCDEFLSHGRHVESITANGVTVQVSIEDSGWKYRANVAVSNQSGWTMDIVPGIITLDELTPNVKSLYATSPEKLAHTTTHQVLWTLANAVPSKSAVANFSAVSEQDRLANRPDPTPDYLNPHLALASTHHQTFEREQPVDIESIALKSGSVPAGQITAGVMWFERDNGAHELSMRVPVGDMVYDFSFSLQEKK